MDNSTRTSRAAKGALASFLQYGLQIVLQIALAPLVLKIAGKETLGAYAALMQLIVLLSLVDLGFNSTLMRYLSQAYGVDDDNQRFKEIFNTGRTFLLISNLIFAFLLILLSFRIGELLSLSDSVYIQAKWGILFLAFWAVIRTPLVLYGGGLIATQNLATSNLIAIISTTARLLLSLGFVALDFGLVGLIFANILADMSGFLIERNYFRKFYPAVRFGWGFSNKALFKEMLKFGFLLMLINITTRLIFNTDSIIAGYLYNASAASIYYTTQIPTFAGIVFIFKLTDNSAPAINELYAKRSISSLQNGYLRLYRYTLLLAIPLLFGILFFNFPFISLWVGKEQYAGDIMTISLAVFALLTIISHVNCTFLYAFGTVRIIVIIGFIAGILKIALSLFLGQLLGVQGIMVGSVISEILTFIPISFFTFRCLNLSLHQVWNDAVKPSLSAGILPLCVGLLIIIIFKPIFNLWDFIILIGLFLVASLIGTFFCGLRPLEKEKILSYCKDVMKLK